MLNLETFQADLWGNCLLTTSTLNTFAASYLKSQGLNNSRLKSSASTLVDLTFQSHALRSALSA